MNNRIKMFVLLALVLSSCFLSGFGEPPPEEFLVERVVDGDTIVLVGGERIRYIGINTPETKDPRKPIEHFGPEASEANRKLVEGKYVRLEYDVQKMDIYKRTLAYVYVGNIFVNAWLVENGYANTATYPPNVKYSKLFVSLEAEARENNRGLWVKE